MNSIITKIITLGLVFLLPINLFSLEYLFCSCHPKNETIKSTNDCCSKNQSEERKCESDWNSKKNDAANHKECIPWIYNEIVPSIDNLAKTFYKTKFSANYKIDTFSSINYLDTVYHQILKKNHYVHYPPSYDPLIIVLRI